MKFDDFVKKRRRLGIKTYGKNSHKDLKHNKLIQMAQEELGDFVWYIIWLEKRGTNLLLILPLVEWLYNLLEKRKI